MTSAQLKNFVLTPVVLSAAVFTVLASPLAVFGSKPLIIQFQEEPVFQGQLRDFSTPYLSLTTAVSLVAGIASVAVSGWRLSAQKSSQAEAQLSQLEKNLKQQEILLEQLKLSEDSLDASGMSNFIEEQVTPKTAQQSLEAKPTPVPVVEPLVIMTQPLEAIAVLSSLKTVQATTVKSATSRFASAQTYLGYAQTKDLAQPSTTTNSSASEEVELPEEVEFLHTQLQQIMAQMASLQTAISSTPAALKSETQVPAKLEAPKVLQSWSVHEMAS